jgi:hypothetical protein
MATIVRLTEEQIAHLLNEMETIELELKSVHEELARAELPRDTLKHFERVHNRYSVAANFIRRQRELARDA